MSIPNTLLPPYPTTTYTTLHRIVKIEVKDSGIIKKDEGDDYKIISLLLTDLTGHKTDIQVFSNDLSLGIEGVKS